MVYDWDVHQETCYQLYIIQGKSLEDIMDHMKNVYRFAPRVITTYTTSSKRAFQTQFRRWNFPPKLKPAYKNAELVSRIKELWEKNLAQREMLQVLNEQDGFDIKPRELMRVRTRNRWLLRVPNGDKSKASILDDDDESQEDVSSALGEHDDSALALHQDHAAVRTADGALSATSPESQHDLEGFGETTEKLTKKRRKRVRPFVNHLGGPARFPSEMTIDEARLILSLDLVSYRNLRSTFQTICQEENVVKKTLAGADTWEAVKARLVREVLELQTVMWASKDNLESKKRALDIICTDVTKRLRNMETRMTLAEAKNALGVNPQESREIRLAFQQVLCDARFTCKSEATPQQWEALKQRWSERSELVKSIVSEFSNAIGAQKARALEVIAKDVMKRLRDERVRKDSRKGQQSHHSPEAAMHSPQELGGVKLGHVPRPSSTGEVDEGDGVVGNNFDAMSEVSHASHMAFSPPNGTMGSHLPISLQSQSSSLSDSRDSLPQPPRVLGSSISTGMSLGSPMDPSLLLGAGAQAAFLDQSFVQQPYSAATSTGSVFHQVHAVPTAMAVYLRLHPSSSFVGNTSLWIATISSHSLQELRQTAVSKFPGALCVRVEGVLKDGKGGELPLQIEQDQELGAYLAHLQGGAPTFNVQLVWKTS